MQHLTWQDSTSYLPEDTEPQPLAKRSATTEVELTVISADALSTQGWAIQSPAVYAESKHQLTTQNLYLQKLLEGSTLL